MFKNYSMKVELKKYLAFLIFIFIFSCDKKDITAQNINSETSLEQKAQVLTNSSGEKITIVYFAKGNEVAVKLKVGDKEQELTAKGTNPKGEPIFSNGKYAWELMEDGHSGRLSDENRKSEIFK